MSERQRRNISAQAATHALAISLDYLRMLRYRDHLTKIGRQRGVGYYFDFSELVFVAVALFASKLVGDSKARGFEFARDREQVIKAAALETSGDPSCIFTLRIDPFMPNGIAITSVNAEPPDKIMGDAADPPMGLAVINVTALARELRERLRTYQESNDEVHEQ
jgi:hypothetical protein